MPRYTTVTILNKVVRPRESSRNDGKPGLSSGFLKW